MGINLCNLSKTSSILFISCVICSFLLAPAAMAVVSAPSDVNSAKNAGDMNWFRSETNMRMQANVELRQLQFLVEKKQWTEADKVFENMEKVRDRRSH
jgi:hypothetical protein